MSSQRNLLPKLPNELMLEIWSHLRNERGTLFKLLLLNSRYRTIIESILYRTMMDWVRSASFTGFITAVNNNHRLASYCRHVGIVEDSLHAYEYANRGVHHGDIYAALKSMKNLTRFTLQLYQGGETNQFSVKYLLMSLGHAKLEMFKLNWEGLSQINARGVEDLMPFIREQQAHLSQLSLRLRLEYSPGVNQIRPRKLFSCSLLLANLSHLVADYPLIRAILPHSPRVTSLIWNCHDAPGSRLAEVETDRFSEIIGNITHLSIYDRSYGREPPPPPEDLFKTILSGPRSLRYIRLDLVAIAYEDIAKKELAETYLPDLQVIVITNSSTDEAYGSQWDMTRLFATHLSLETIYTGPLELYSTTIFRRRKIRSSYAIPEERQYLCWKMGDTLEAAMDSVVLWEESVLFEDLSHLLVNNNVNEGL